MEAKTASAGQQEGFPVLCAGSSRPKGVELEVRDGFQSNQDGMRNGVTFRANNARDDDRG